MSLEMAQKVIVQQKIIMSRSFLNSGTLIFITETKETDRMQRQKGESWQLKIYPVEIPTEKAET
jgi:hypothetical protein